MKFEKYFKNYNKSIFNLLNDLDISIEILKLFEELNREGTTIVFATHSQEIIKLGNHRIINLNRGKAETI